MMAGRVVLEVVEGCPADRGKQWEYTDYYCGVFGRANDCGGQFSEEIGNKDEMISRRHFILEVNPPEASLRDFGSRHRTFVNDQPTGGRRPEETAEEGQRMRHPEIELRHGDRIRLGEKTEMAVRIAAVCAKEDCDAEISDSLRGHLCRKCQREVLQSARDISVTIRCGDCGRDVSAEAAGRQGDYICERCRGERFQRAEDAKQRPLGGAAAAPPDAPEIPGLTIERLLESGGQGSVYLARNDRGEALAVKTMLAQIAIDKQARLRFENEIKALRRLRHPNIVSLLQDGSAGSSFYFVMEYCQGGSLLDQLQRRRRPFLPEEAAPYMFQAMEAMAHAHNAPSPYVHRDLKPGNILLAGQPGSFVAKVSDFGLAKSFQTVGFSGMVITKEGQLGGTYAFMPREQLTDFVRVKPVSDVWSLAATFYYLLTKCYTRDFQRGIPPPTIISKERVIPIRDRDPSIDKALAMVIDRALDDDVAKRYPTAREFREALGKVLSC